MSKLRTSSALKDITKTLPTTKRVIRQSESNAVMTNAPKAEEIAFRVMFNPKLAYWLEIKEVLLYNLSNPDAIPFSNLKALKIFVQLMVSPLHTALTFEIDDQKDLMSLIFTNRSLQGNPLANAVYLYISFQTRIQWITFRKQKIEQVFLTQKFTYKLQTMHSDLISFLTSYFQTLDNKVDSCSAHNVVDCLLFLQQASQNLDNLFVICDILVDTQRVLKKKCASYIEQERLLRCEFLQMVLGQVAERVKKISRHLEADDRPAFQKFIVDIQELTSAGSPLDQANPITILKGPFPVDRKKQPQYAQITNWYKQLAVPPLPDDPTAAKHQIEIPARISVVGRSGQGKTNAVLNFIERTLPVWKRVVVFTGGTIEEPLYKHLHLLFPTVEFFTNINDPRLKLSETTNTMGNKLIIFDDFVAMKPKDLVLIQTYATNSRNFGWTCIFIGQKLAGDNGIPKVIRDQCNYFFIFRIRNKGDVRMIKDVAHAQEGDGFDECYQEATKEPMNFLMIDVESDKKYRRNFLQFCSQPQLPKDTLTNFYKQFGLASPKRPESWTSHYIMLPARICILGASGNGKTNLMVELIHRFGFMWNRIVIFTGGSKMQPLYQKLEKGAMSETGSNVGFDIIDDLSRLELTKDQDPDVPKLIFFDDFMNIPDKKVIIQYAIASRKYGWTCVFLAQKFAGSTGIAKVIRDQCNYFFIFPGLNQQQIREVKKNVDVNEEVFDKCYARVSKSKVSLKKAGTQVKDPFVLIDVETNDERLSLRIGFDFSCSDYRVLPA
jgi:hypothetical protein